MQYTMNFGTMAKAAAGAGDGSTAFRLAVLGDFSGRANRGELETGDDLAKRKPIKVDVDNIDKVIAKLGIQLRIPVGDDGAIELAIDSMDAFHPDELYENVELFEEMSGLRQRLENSGMFASAAKEMTAWLGDEAVQKHRRKRPKSRAAAVPVNGRLSDFAQLIGKSSAVDDAETDADELIKRVVAPYVVAEEDPDQEAMVTALDEAISDAMRGILHHPDFQALESLWRSVDFLTRRIETGSNLKILLYDITAEEIAADLSSAENLEDTGLYKLFVEQPPSDAQIGSLSAILGNYVFEQTPPHAELLGRMAKIAAAATASFLTSLGPDCLTKQDPDDIHPLVKESWGALYNLPEAAYIGLTVPRFLLRHPYGAKSDPIDEFEFEEFTPDYGLRGMLWGNAAIMAGLLLAETFSQQGMKKMNLGSIMSIGDMPYYVFNDADGEQVALPCTERVISVTLCEFVVSQRLMPVLSIRGTPEIRLGSFQSLAGQMLSGPWAPLGAAPAEEEAPPADETPDDSTEMPDDDDMSEDDSEEMDSELAALLSGLDDDDSSSDDLSSDDDDGEEMDAELAALLADL